MSVSAAQPVRSAPSTASAIKTHSLAEGVFILFALTIVQRVVGFLRGILFCRWLDAEQLGQWDLSFSFMVLAAPLAVLGLPGSFGRYAERYREQGLLRTFLRRTALVSLLPAALFCIAMAAAAPWTAEFVFGSREQAPLVLTLAASIAGFVLFNFLLSLFTSLRSTRIVSHMQFLNTVLFAGVSLLLMATWNDGAIAAVAGFGIACFASVAVAARWVVRLWRELPTDEAPLPQRDLWTRLAPFAFWVWVVNWISNSFEIADRYLIVHFSGLSSDAALALVGQYHSARVIPVLFLSLAELLASLATPHLVRDWEAGRRETVAARLRLVLKLFGLSFVCIAIGLALGSPLFFHTALRDKFGFGQAIFPWTLACTIWTGLAYITHNWMWCAERSRLVTIGLVVALVSNVVLNLALLPQYGLEGVVWAAAFSRVAMLIVDLLICRMLGMRIGRGLLVVCLLPTLLLVGPWAAACGALVAASGIVPALGLFNTDEKRLLREAASTAVARFAPFLVSRVARRRAPAERAETSPAAK